MRSCGAPWQEVPLPPKQSREPLQMCVRTRQGSSIPVLTNTAEGGRRRSARHSVTRINARPRVVVVGVLLESGPPLLLLCPLSSSSSAVRHAVSTRSPVLLRASLTFHQRCARPPRPPHDPARTRCSCGIGTAASFAREITKSCGMASGLLIRLSSPVNI